MTKRQRLQIFADEIREHLEWLDAILELPRIGQEEVYEAEMYATLLRKTAHKYVKPSVRLRK